jgi:hypothetical protein
MNPLALQAIIVVDLYISIYLAWLFNASLRAPGILLDHGQQVIALFGFLVGFSGALISTVSLVRQTKFSKCLPIPALFFCLLELTSVIGILKHGESSDIERTLPQLIWATLLPFLWFLVNAFVFWSSHFSALIQRETEKRSDQ